MPLIGILVAGVAWLQPSKLFYVVLSACVVIASLQTPLISAGFYRRNRTRFGNWFLYFGGAGFILSVFVLIELTGGVFGSPFAFFYMYIISAVSIAYKSNIGVWLVAITATLTISFSICISLHETTPTFVVGEYAAAMYRITSAAGIPEDTHDQHWFRAVKGGILVYLILITAVLERRTSLETRNPLAIDKA